MSFSFILLLYVKNLGSTSILFPLNHADFQTQSPLFYGRIFILFVCSVAPGSKVIKKNCMNYGSKFAYRSLTTAVKSLHPTQTILHLSRGTCFTSCSIIIINSKYKYQGLGGYMPCWATQASAPPSAQKMEARPLFTILREHVFGGLCS